MLTLTLTTTRAIQEVRQAVEALYTKGGLTLEELAVERN